VATNADSLEADKNGALWVVQVFGATLFFLTGTVKLAGGEQVVQMFAAIGIGQWFRHAMGLIEFASAILLLIPALAGTVALLCIPMMIGTILMHLTIGGSSGLPIALLIIATIVAWGRKETTLRLIRRNDPKSVRQATNAFSEVS
jgi:putative oxidoreductase